MIALFLLFSLHISILFVSNIIIQPSRVYMYIYIIIYMYSYDFILHILCIYMIQYTYVYKYIYISILVQFLAYHFHEIQVIPADCSLFSGFFDTSH